MGSLSHFVNSFSLSDCPCSCHVTKTFNSHWLINFLLVNKSKLLWSNKIYILMGEVFSVYQLLRPRSLSIGRFWGKDGSEKGRELSLLPLPPPPSKISSHLAPSEGLTLRLKAAGNTYPLINL